MNDLDLAGHIFYIFLACGVYLLSKKDINGWLYRLVGETGWVALGLIMGMTSIWIWGLIFMVIDIRGFLEWRKKE